MIEVETQTTEVEAVTNTEVTSTGQVEVETVDLNDLDITVAKKEYVITGDNIYVPMLYADAPQWMKDLVNLAVDVSMETANASSLAQLTSILTEFATSYVPLNQYTQSILDLSNADSSIHSLITTLNSNFKDGLNEANSQIITLSYTKASKAEVVTQVIDTIASQLATPGSSLSSIVARLDQAIVNETSARALSMEVLTASLNDVSGNVSVNSSAITGLQTNVSNINGTLTSQAGQITNLRSDLTSGTGTWLTGDTNVTNTVKSYTDGKVLGVESKWEYNSSLTINGTSYNSGFGLSNSAGTGAGSEFWINADKFKFTNNGKTGSKAPFTIEASGPTPQITFNGIVSFSNVSNVPQLGSTPQQVVDAVNNGQTTTINGSKITTGSISAAQIAANSISADRLSSTNGNSTVWTGGGLVSQNFNGNVSGYIGNPTSGFRLSSGASGTSDDPNIYGAYIRGSYIQGSTIDVEDMKVRAVGYPNNFGRISFASKNISVVMPGYGTGFMQNRLCSKSVGIIKVDCWARGYDDRVKIALQYSTNNIDWINIRIHSSLVAGMTNSSHVIVSFSELIDNNIADDNGYILFRMVDAGSEQPATNIYSDIIVSIFNS